LLHVADARASSLAFANKPEPRGNRLEPSAAFRGAAPQILPRRLRLRPPDGLWQPATPSGGALLVCG